MPSLTISGLFPLPSPATPPAVTDTPVVVVLATDLARAESESGSSGGVGGGDRKQTFGRRANAICGRREEHHFRSRPQPNCCTILQRPLSLSLSLSPSLSLPPSYPLHGAINIIIVSPFCQYLSLGTIWQCTKVEECQLATGAAEAHAGNSRRARKVSKVTHSLIIRFTKASFAKKCSG